jgi:hypothetical protein
VPFVAAGAVTGIGSLPLTSITSAVRSVAEFSPEVPFWPQLPQLSERESIVGQGLGIVENLIEPRDEGYGYQVKGGQIDSVLEILHRSSGELTSANVAGFGAFEEALSSGLFSSAVAVKGQIEGPITLSAYLFHKGRPFLADPALFAAIAFHVGAPVVDGAGEQICLGLHPAPILRRVSSNFGVNRTSRSRPPLPWRTSLRFTIKFPSDDHCPSSICSVVSVRCLHPKLMKVHFAGAFRFPRATSNSTILPA